MKRIIVYAALVAAVLMVSVHGTDVGKLRPVQAISLYEDGGKIVIETDTKDVGVGQTPELALKNLKETTPAVIYLDTADYLLVTENMLEHMDWIRANLKASVRVCRMEEKIDPKAAAEYLKVHKDLPKLKVLKEGENLPILKHFGERIILLEKNENIA